MKILHTSDWHLGQSFLTKSRREEHQAFINWLLILIEKESINAVIVAGDIFDTGTPPSYAREMYNQFVVAISKLNCTLIVLAGNHDSVSTLNESKDILACLNTYVITTAGEDIHRQLFTLKNSQAEIGAILCAVPFIRPRDLLTSSGGETGLQKERRLGKPLRLIITRFMLPRLICVMPRG
ncbi:exonuclease subunit SbcD [Psychromonas sp. MME2]|uniref:exonuclease subunit SbcD n=1 Tax=Psychromonas sp. MME2 TaxID=3231033 RepID=UPI00339C7356